MKRLAPIVALLVLGLAAPPVARADDAPKSPNVDEGRTRFGRGVELFRDHDFAAALVEFRRAYEAAPSYRILYNLGQSCFELHDYAGALDYFQRYLRDGGAEVSGARRKEVQKDIDDLTTRVSRLTITTTPGGAEVSIDDQVLGTSPFAAPIVVSAGRRKVSARLAGRVSASKVIDVGGGETANVTLDLEEPAVVAPSVVTATALPPPPPSAPPPPPPVPAKSPTPVWVGLATTGVLGATTALFGVLTVRANDRFEDTLRVFPGQPSAIADARSTVHVYAHTTDVLLGVTVISAGITTYFAITRLGPSGNTVGARVGPRDAALSLTF